MSSKYTLTPHTLLATQDIQQNIHYISVIAAIFEIVGISFSYRAFIRVKNNDEGNLLKAKYRHVPITRFSEYDKSELIYGSISSGRGKWSRRGIYFIFWSSSVTKRFDFFNFSQLF